MTALVQLWRQVAYENKAFWRNPAAAVFTVALPVVMLVTLTSVFDDTTTLPGGFEVDLSTYYLVASLTFAVFSTCYTNIAMSITMSRDAGTLRRVRVTPLSPVVYVLAKVLHSVAVMAGLVILTVAFGALAYDVSVPAGTLLAFSTTIALGAAAFCALGVAVTTIIPNAAAAPAVMNAFGLPVLFLSGTFMPIDNAPGWVRVVADIFPVRHYIEAAFAGFGLDSGAAGGWRFDSLAVIVAWGLFGGLVSVRYFRWTSRH